MPREGQAEAPKRMETGVRKRKRQELRLPLMAWDTPGNLGVVSGESREWRGEGTQQGYNAIEIPPSEGVFPPGKMISEVWRSVVIGGESQAPSGVR